MCILFVHADPEPPRGGYRLVVASNRDEFYTRRAQGADMCQETGVIGGRDMHRGREGGMWLGVSTRPAPSSKIRFAALLNVTGEERKGDAEGRGFVVADYLSTPVDLPDYLETLRRNGPHNAFNMVSAELGERGAKIYHHSNLQEGLGVYEGRQTVGFGNSNPQAPFAKVERGLERFRGILERKGGDKEGLIEELMALLKWEERHLPDPELQRRAPHAYQELSSVFVKIEQAGYGTRFALATLRTHSIVLVDEQWNVDFVESTMEEPIDLSKPNWLHKHIVSRL